MTEIVAKSILSDKNSMNIYRGSTHGCIYCDSRSECYGMTYSFEDIQVKVNAVELLDKALAKKRKKCMIITGSMTDVNAILYGVSEIFDFYTQFLLHKMMPIGFILGMGQGKTYPFLYIISISKKTISITWQGFNYFLLPLSYIQCLNVFAKNNTSGCILSSRGR